MRARGDAATLSVRGRIGGSDRARSARRRAPVGDGRRGVVAADRLGAAAAAAPRARQRSDAGGPRTGAARWAGQPQRAAGTR
ncbi:MAG: hypothetical protein RMJ54_15255 [Roseiflexaceae bacterium]|nr:hypothetical protein [Roseiflexaceae bacterium]